MGLLMRFLKQLLMGLLMWLFRQLLMGLLMELIRQLLKWLSILRNSILESVTIGFF